MNQFIENPKEEPRKEPKQKAAKEYKAAKFARSFLDGSLLTWKNVSRLMPFLFFLTFLAILYIGNNYVAQRTFRKIENLKNELKELRSQHISIKSELMQMSKQSEVAKRVESYGLFESVVPPKIILIKEKEKNTEQIEEY